MYGYEYISSGMNEIVQSLIGYWHIIKLCSYECATMATRMGFQALSGAVGEFHQESERFFCII